MNVPVIYANDEVVVINKPADLTMDGDGPSTTVERWATEYMKEQGIFCHEHEELEQQHKRRKQLKFVHQLDGGTSGVLCLAFTKDMASRLAHCFEMRTTEKAYLAVLDGHLPHLATLVLPESCATGAVDMVEWAPLRVPSSRTIRPRSEEVVEVGTSSPVQVERYGPWQDSQTMEHYTRILCCDGDANDDGRVLAINMPVGLDASDASGFRMAIFGASSRSALTHLRVLERGWYEPRPGNKVAATRVLLLPQTGRRHQLRLHCHAIGYPILGDVAYQALPPTPYSLRTQDEGVSEPGQWPRMYLHAWRLCLPGSLRPCSSEAERVELKKKRRRETRSLEDAAGNAEELSSWTELVASDPFPPLIIITGTS